MSDILERFQQIVKEVQERPYLEVVKFAINPPIEAAALKAVEDHLGAPLAAPIKDFYQEANGLEFQWRFRLDLKKKEVAKLDKEFDDYVFELLDSSENPFANINLIPLEDAIIHRKWDMFDEMPADPIEFAGKAIPQPELAKRIRPFDLCSSYFAMAFVLEAGNGNPPAMLISSYYMGWDKSRLTDFESYLEMLLATRGIIAARDEIYTQYRGDLQPLLLTKREYWTEEHIPKLFRKKA